MICQRCLFRLQGPATKATARLHGSVRTYALKGKASNTPPPPNPASPRGPPTETHEGHPAATSSSAAQPFSSREMPGGEPARSPTAPKLGPSGSADEIESLPRVKSSVPAGQPLKGLSYFKNKEGPVALEDHEYPAWLWTLLDQGAKGSTNEAAALEGNLYSKSKAQRKKAVRALRNRSSDDTAAHLPKVPLEQQTIDLPVGDGTRGGAIEAGQVRQDLTHAMRSQRRKNIKETNYLKTMN